MFDKKIDELLGKDTVNHLKNTKYKDNNDSKDNRYLYRDDDYYYLRIFQERYRDLTDNDFKDDKEGIKTREEYIDHLYHQFQEILDGLTIKPHCVYGDSVLGDTPIIIKQNDTVIFKEIKDIIKDWKPYELFKCYDSNRKDKQQNNNRINYKVYSDKGWTNINRIIRHKCKKKIYRVITDIGFIDVTEDHSLLDSNYNIIKPSECNNKTVLLHSFPSDYDNIKSSSCKQFNNKCNALKEYYYLKSKGHNIRIDIDNSNIQLTTIEQHSKGKGHIYEIIDLGYTDDYVYDIETEYGRFNAGVGELVVKNTDSIFVGYGIADRNNPNKVRTDKKSLEVAIKIGILCGDMINLILPSPHNLEYEKTFYPWISLSKKRYVGNLYETNPDKYYQKSMGIVLKRRDNTYQD
jgi:hypothetical protein